MTIAIVLGLLLLAVVLFSIERISPDLIGLGILAALIFTGILSEAEAFKGFGSEFIVMLAAIFIIGTALQENGIIDAAAMRLTRTTQMSQTWLLVLVMFFAGLMSAFMNNTAVAAVLVAPCITLAKRLGMSPAKLLMPMAFAALLGGTCTLIGTSTNIAGNDYIVKYGMDSMTMFELLPLGFPLLLVGVLYMATIGKRWLPGHIDETFTDKYEMRNYLSEIIVLPNSRLAGRSLYNLDLGEVNVRILKIIRNKQDIFPDTNTLIEVNDLLLVEGTRDDLMKMHGTTGIDILGEIIQDQDLQGSNVKLVEILVTPHAELINNTLKNTDFRKKHHLSVLAIHRKNYNFTEKIAHETIKLGDVLLVQGRQDDIDLLQRSTDMVVINELNYAPPLDLRKGFLSLGLFGAAIILGSLEIVSMSLAFLVAATLVMLFRCLDTEAAYNSIDWRLLILIGSMTAFGTAMKKTGADVFLAQQVVTYLEPLGVYAILGGFMVLTVLLTQPMSNAAAAMVVLPVALSTAAALGVNERTFAIAVISSASVSMVTPFEPCCILVFSAGGYSIRDFMKIGGLLTFLLLGIMLWLIPLIWGL
ncbi:MAG: SLC13 family permease [Chitinophagales bacterium]|nr:SLC13 family permease [Chitinophagales bacterium]